MRVFLTVFVFIGFLGAFTEAKAKTKKANNDGIDGSYVVTYKPEVQSVRGKANGLLKKGKKGIELSNLNMVTLDGVDDNDLAEFENDPDVLSIDQDVIVYQSCVTKSVPTFSIYDPPQWGTDRLDKANPDYDNQITFEDSVRNYDEVVAYVLDTGIDVSHPDFQGRAHWVSSYYEDFDGSGHGSHVAGTIGGYYLGVAKRVQLYSLKVLSNAGSGNFANLLSALDWVIGNHTARAAAKGYAKSVINLSLGVSSLFQPINDAVKKAVDSGVFCSVAAGNSAANIDTTLASPASTPEALTVGASDINDRISSFSNYGTLVDIFAPGELILSVYAPNLVGKKSKRHAQRRGIRRPKHSRSTTSDTTSTSARTRPTSDTVATSDTTPASASYTTHDHTSDRTPPTSDTTRTTPEAVQDLPVPDTSTNFPMAYFSGTSMAAPQVAGVVAAYLQNVGPYAPTAYQVNDWVRNTGVPVVTNVCCGTTTLLAQVKRCP